MNTLNTKTSLLALAVAALLSVGATAANAQGFTPPNTDIRALEAPVDVTPSQLRAFGDKVYDGRSVAPRRSVAAPAYDGLDGQDR